MRRRTAALLLIFIFIFAGSAAAQNGSVPQLADPAYEILSCDVEAELLDNGQCRVSETISVHFMEECDEFVWRTPSVDENGGDIRFTDVDVPGFSVSRQKDDSWFSLTISESGGFGEYEDFTIEYTRQAAMEPDEESGLILFSLPLVGSDWNSAIPTVEFSLELPGPAEGPELRVLSGYYGVMPEERARIIRSSAAFIGSVDGGLIAFEALGLELTLPDDYFKSTDMVLGVGDVISLLCPWVPILLCAASLLLWSAKNRNRRTKPELRYSPPEGCTCADAAYILNGSVSGRDLAALVFQWASAGYLSVEGRGRDTTLCALMDMGSERKAYEQRLFEQIFAEGDRVTLRGRRHRLSAAASEAGYAVEKYWRGTSDSKIYRDQSVLSLLISRLFCCIAMAMSLVALQCSAQDMAMYSGIWTLPFLISGFLISLLLQWSGAQVLSVMTRGGLFGRLMRCFGALLPPLLLALIIAAIGGTWQSSLLTFIFGLCSICTGWAVSHGIKRTEYGCHMLEEIQGFSMHISSARRQLSAVLLERDPQYFYQLVPYAVTLGKVELWAAAFDKLPMDPPDWSGDESAVGESAKFSAGSFVRGFSPQLSAVASAFKGRARGSSGRGKSAGRRS